ncbi:MAG: biotin/lipoyl-binding protein [Anaerolineales bacterium]|nr:biotin/lipoyl-binding protein [Anaerolineales bacterium]
MKFAYQYRGQLYEVELIPTEGGYVASVDGRRLGQVGPTSLDAPTAREGRQVWIHAAGRTFALQRAVGSRSGASAASGEQTLRAPMPGQVRSVFVRAGQQVAAGQVLLTLEAMKMEIRIQAPGDGKVARLAVAQGDSVEREQILVELESETS